MVYLMIGGWLLTGCGDVDESPGGAGAPISATSSAPNPEGAKLFAEYCVACHGEDGRGQDGLAGNLREDPRTLSRSPTELFLAIKHGRSGPSGLMPAWGAVMSDDQITAVLSYMQQAFGEA